LQLILAIAGGGTLIVILIAALAFAVRRVFQQKKNIDQLTDADIVAFREGSTGLSSNSSGSRTSRWSRPRDSIIANAPVFAKPYNNQYEIPRENIKIDETTILGRGNFCTVMKGYVITAQGLRLPAAVKKVKENGGVYYRSLLTELKILSDIGRHPNLVSVVAACTQNLADGELFVAVELCTNGNFRNYLKDRRSFYEDLLIDGKLVVRRNSMQSIQ
jgi:serine/threonine protein kinase